MNVGEICQREVVTIGAREGLIDAARLMREKHIGYLVVVDATAAPADMKPVGVITDRDVVVAVVARGIDPATLAVGDVMSAEPVVVSDEAPIAGALQQMRRIGVRRLPVVGHRGELTGILSLDDVLDTLSDELQSVAGTIRNERRIETTLRR
jgi:CBS domain-containing protein